MFLLFSADFTKSDFLMMFAEKKESENIFYASDLSENFVNMINAICAGSRSKIEFKNLDIDAK